MEETAVPFISVLQSGRKACAAGRSASGPNSGLRLRLELLFPSQFKLT
jgi:hypothetical protein